MPFLWTLDETYISVRNMIDFSFYPLLASSIFYPSITLVDFLSILPCVWLLGRCGLEWARPHRPVFGWKWSGLGSSPMGNISRRCGLEWSAKNERTTLTRIAPHHAVSLCRVQEKVDAWAAAGVGEREGGVAAEAGAGEREGGPAVGTGEREGRRAV